MLLKANENIKAAIEVNGSLLIGMENSIVYDHIQNEDAFLYIKSKDGLTEIKLRFVYTKDDNVAQIDQNFINTENNESGS